ncbi:hypothetical protein NIES4071_78170 [Calothrix sp. NIES-4071]|nr:hypothetical protein NIES4071_78170 [Calothrix sp. NIES-4071]BAZ62089.1 hypothetical protein NIES4105_78100 [Calothrix sp. NIES-4105]
MQLNERASRLPLAPILLIAPFFLWGTAMVAMKGVIDHTTPMFMAGVRIIPAGILILIAGAFMGKPQPRSIKAWLWILLFALVDGAMFQGFLAQGLVRTGAGLGSVMIDSQPLAVALMSLWLFKEHIGLWGWLGLSLGVAGISFIGLPHDLILNLISMHDITFELKELSSLPEALFKSGEWLMLLAALSMAVGTVLIRYVTKHVDPVIATGWHMIIGGLPLWGISAVTETQQWSNLVASDWIALSYATIFGSAVAYALFFYFASSGNLTSLSSLTFLTPVFALCFGNLLLGEVLSSIQWTGVGLTLISIYLINQRDTLALTETKTIVKEITAVQQQNTVTVPVKHTKSEVMRS